MMFAGIIDELLGPGMVANIVAELFGIIVTVLVVERYLTYWENRKKRAARQLCVSSLGRRLDLLAQDWGWVLNFLTSIGTTQVIDNIGELLDSFSGRLDKVAQRITRQDTEEGQQSKESVQAHPDHVNDRLKTMLALKLEHIASRFEDVLNAVDAAGIIMSPSMLDLLVELRETTITNLRGIRDFENLLENPSSEQANTLFTSAMSASLSCRQYIDVLERLWKAIPSSGNVNAPTYEYLRALRSVEDQAQLVRNFLYLQFPEYDPKRHWERMKERR